jgi:hypothetical protein
MRRTGRRRAGSTALALATTALGVTCLAGAAAPGAVPAPTAPAQAPTQDGLLRVAHLSPSTGAVDMYAQGPGLPLTRVASSVSYRGVTSYVPEVPGVYTLQARPAGAPATTPPALSASVAVAPGSAQTAAFVDVGPGSTPQAEVLTDSTTTPPPGSALVRIIAAAAGVGPVDVSAEGGGQLASGVFYGAASSYATVAARNWTMDVSTRTGETARTTVPVGSSSVNSVIVSRDPEGALSVTAVTDAATVVPAAAPAPAAPAPAGSAPAAPAPAAPAPARSAPSGGVPAGFGALAGVLAPSVAPAAAAMPVISAPADPRAVLRPTGLAVPDVDLRADHLDDLATDRAGALQVPADPQELGWFTGGAVPGQAGPAVVVGHVDSWQGPGVFWRLRDLHRGDPIDVARSDGTVAHFAVDSVESFDKDAFPTDRVYGPTPGPALRLVTCGGVFDRGARSYLDNVVVFASPR